MCAESLPAAGAAGGPRRGFLAQLLACVLGAIAYATPVAAGVFAFLNPLRQKSASGRSFRLASLDMLDQTPRKFPVIADRTDAWNRFPKQPIGAVWLRKTDGGEVEALSAVCPHAGCGVEWHAGEGKYFCPCHTASFRISGQRLDKVSPSPRDMDSLEVDQEKLTQGEVWVKFEDFVAGIPEKMAR